MSVCVVQLVEGMKEALLGLLFAADEMDIINEQHADTSVFIAELLGALLAEGTHELVGELLGTGANHVNVVGKCHLSDSVEQVGLTQAGTSVYKRGL